MKVTQEDTISSRPFLNGLQIDWLLMPRGVEGSAALLGGMLLGAKLFPLALS